MRQVFLDTETTGLSAADGDRIVEIGCIEMVNRRLSGKTLHHYLNPERSSHPDALRVHGLTDEFLADKPHFAQVAEELLAFVKGAEVVIHNASFDMAFLDAECRRAGCTTVRVTAERITDSLLMAREQYPGKANSLDALCKRLEVDNTSRTLHGALLDAGLLAEVYIRMTRGQGSLVADEVETDASGAGLAALAPKADLRSFNLVEHRASAEDRATHATILADIQRANGGKLVWQAELPG